MSVSDTWQNPWLTTWGTVWEGVVPDPPAEGEVLDVDGDTIIDIDGDTALEAP